MLEFAHTIIAVLSVTTAIVSMYLYKYANKKEKVFIYYIIAIGFFELFAIVLLKIMSDGNNLPGLHLYTLFQFVLLTLFFNACLKELSSRFKYKWVLAIGVIGIIANSLFVQSIFTYNSYSKSAVELYVIIMSLVLFTLFLKDKTNEQVNMKASVSFVSAVFLQSAVSIILYIYSNDIMEMKASLRDLLFYLRIVINYISLFMILFGMWQIFTRKKIFLNNLNTKV